MSSLHVTDRDTEDQEVARPAPDRVVIWKPGPVLVFRLWQKPKNMFMFQQSDIRAMIC